MRFRKRSTTISLSVWSAEVTPGGNEENNSPLAPMGWKLEHLFVSLFELQKLRNHSKNAYHNKKDDSQKDLLNRDRGKLRSGGTGNEETANCDKIIGRWCKVIYRDQRANPVGHRSSR
ncbi:hypothetical protein AVEN_60179-1 [Araneus ventricosus]|uniref:Uncharacterized protein n=1 Tax=Araneus ventricosus TaxID=182803 RepID=A0A4Y2A1N6_ARAVE|nr:hypothetical protein AVEN_60179-1 [Araneus ventricosus]